MEQRIRLGFVRNSEFRGGGVEPLKPPLGTPLLGRSRNRLEDNIKMYLQEVVWTGSSYHGVGTRSRHL
jgi:hypothetical protein